MPKAKAQQEQPEETAVTITPRKKRGKPVAVEVHEVKRTWAEEVVVGEKPRQPRKSAQATEEIAEAELEDDADEYDLPDEVAAVLEEYSADAGIMMEINRLPNYVIDRRTDPVAWHWVTTMPFTPNFKQEIGLRHAKAGESNWFLIVLKDQNGRIVKQAGRSRIGPFAVEAAPPEEKIKHGIPLAPQSNVIATVNQATPPIIVQPEPQDPLAGVKQTAALVKELQAIGLVPKPHREDHAPAQNPQPAPLDPKTAVAQYVMEHPDLAKQAINNLIGGEVSSPKSGIAEMVVGAVIDIAQSLAPSVAPALTNWFQSKAYHEQMKAMQLQQQMNAAQPQNGTHAQLEAPPLEPMPTQPQPAPPLPPQPQEAQPPAPDALLFTQVLNMCAQRKMYKPNIAARELLRMIDAPGVPDGYFDGAVDIFLNNDARELIEFAALQSEVAAALAKQEDVPAWIAALQDELRKEWEQDGDNAPSDN